MNLNNEYIPYPARIEDIKQETFDTKTFRVGIVDPALASSFDYRPGQFMQISVLGAGEIPISITSSPSQKGYLEFTIRATGQVTNAIHSLKKGDILFLRGPYGNGFPFERLRNKNIYFIAGGIGIVPLRSLINLIMGERDNFLDVKILYGAKTPRDLCFKEELIEWGNNSKTEVLLTVDDPIDDWPHSTGVVTELWNETEIDADNAVSIVCGPPIMVRFVVSKLLESGFLANEIIIILERHMKCGVGKCGHCTIGSKFVCIDGPVFSYEQIRSFPTKEHVF